jgi:hypothetical protein
MRGPLQKEYRHVRLICLCEKYYLYLRYVFVTFNRRWYLHILLFSKFDSKQLKAHLLDTSNAKWRHNFFAAFYIFLHIFIYFYIFLYMFIFLYIFVSFYIILYLFIYFYIFYIFLYIFTSFYIFLHFLYILIYFYIFYIFLYLFYLFISFYIFFIFLYLLISFSWSLNGSLYAKSHLL